MLLATPFGLVGCGSGGGGGYTAPTVSPYLGSFAGPFNFVGTTAQFPNQTGTVLIATDSNGNVTGTAHNTTFNQDAVVSGTLDKNGSITSTFVFPNATVTATGTVSIATSGHLVGTLTESLGGNNVGQITVDLTKQ